MVCTTGQYQLTNPPNGVTINWEMQNGNLKIDNGQGTPVLNASKINTGFEIIKVTLTNTCGASLVISKSVTVGSPEPGDITFPLIDYRKVQAQIDPVPAATYYNWYKNETLLNNHGTLIQIPIPRDQCDIGFDVAVAAINNCGISTESHAGAYVPCDNYFVVSPNPASTTVTVSTNESKSLQASSVKIIDAIRIYDNLGNLKKYQTFNKVKMASVNISSLINGNYFIEISNGTFKERKQLVIIK